MCNFNRQDEDTKAFVHLFMKKCAENLGGVNFLLTLIETLRATKPHPLTTNKCEIKAPNATISWNKIIFKDKLLTLEEILVQHRSSEGSNFNILENLSDKKRKKIINMAKTLSPIEFVVTPSDADKEGFSFKVFESIEDESIKINPIFVAIFFCSVEFTKKALKYEV